VRECGVKAVGFDFPQDRGIRADYDPDWSPSADPLDDWACHRLLLTQGVLQIEYLTGLTAIPGDRCVFASVPLKLTISDGAPVRALAFIDSKETGA
jgi:kynurenine formamidase